MKRTRNFYGIEEGFCYIEVRPRPRSRRKKESCNFKLGMGIIGSFLACLATIVIAV